MAQQDERNLSGKERNITTNRTERQSSVPNDLPDSPNDQEKLQPEETTLDLPDVGDIPGQENVHVPPLGMLADTTISSSDEEGDDVFDEEGDESSDDVFDPATEEGEVDYRMGTKGDVTPGMKKALDDTTYMPTTDENQLRRARMDSTDFQGEELNEGSFGIGNEQSGDDLDIPEAEDETRTSSMGQGDEENKYYSLGGADNDNVVEGTP